MSQSINYKSHSFLVACHISDIVITFFFILKHLSDRGISSVIFQVRRLRLRNSKLGA